MDKNMKGYPYINEIAAFGEYYFTTDELAKKYSLTKAATLAVIRRLREKGEIATPHNGFHLIVPPEYRTMGCLPPEQFIHDLMAFLGIPYYVSLLSAGQFYGAAHQKPQIFQVMLPDNRAKIQCGKVTVEFAARKHMNDLPVRKFKTPKGYVNVATPELTALDIANYPLRCGGLNNVVTVLEELSENIDEKALAKLIALIEITAQLQRLGFLLELVQRENLAKILEQELSSRHVKKVLLISKIKAHDKSAVNPRWKIIINETWESDL